MSNTAALVFATSLGLSGYHPIFFKPPIYQTIGSKV